ncbi:MAG: radical SAM protein [Anaerolineales bacterium]|nr:radical SAM protein [Anaerolineales bacterium]
MDLKKRSYLAIIVKPTYDCNMSCEYCSVEGHSTSPRMSLQTVDRLFQRVTDFCGADMPTYLIWHGGEPALMGPNFYDYIGQKTKEYGDFCIVNALQTNATLLDDEFIDIIVEHNYRVSTSLDGPAEIHNRSRKDKKGNPTFDKTMEAVALLKARGIPVGAITVLNKSNKSNMPEIYKFFNEEQIHLRINPVQLHGKAAKNRQDVAISPKEFGREMIKIFDMWYHDPNACIMVDPFRVIIGNIVTGRNYSCDYRRQCHAEVMSVSPLGGVYPCGQFNGNEDYYLGDIHQEGFDEILFSPGMQKLLMRVPENIAACNKCEYVEICNCGCTASAVCRNGDIMQPDFYCAGRKMLFQHIIDTIQANIHKALEFKESLLQTTGLQVSAAI